MVTKLVYFDMTGLGEPIRLMLAAAKIKFEDKRVTKEEWAELKPTLKWPHLPLLEIDGKTLFQSLSICRHIGRKAGLCGSSEDEALLADITVDALDDFRRKVVGVYYRPDSKEREEGLKNVSETVVPFYLKNFEEQLVENNGYLVGGKLTWADVIFLSYNDYLSYMLGHDILPGFPKLKNHVDKLSELQGIKEWLAVRPQPPKDMRKIFE